LGFLLKFQDEIRGRNLENTLTRLESNQAEPDRALTHVFAAATKQRAPNVIDL